MNARFFAAALFSLCLLKSPPAKANDIEFGDLVYPRIPELSLSELADGSGVLSDGDDAGLPLQVREVRDGQLLFRQSGMAGWCSAEKCVPIESAIAYFDQLIEAEPQNTWAINVRANVHLRNGDLEASLADYNSILETETSTGLLINRGMVYRKMDRFEDALKDYTEAIRLKPDSAFARIKRGALLVKSDPEAALEDLNKAAELSPEHPEIYFSRALAHQELGDGKAAFGDYTTMIELDPYHADSYNNRGVMFLHDRKFDQAIVDFSITIRLSPDDAMAYTNRAKALNGKGLPELALLDLDRALELDADYDASYRVRSIVRGRLDQPELAIADINTYLTTNPGDDYQYLRRGQFYARLDQYDQAFADFDKAIEMDPDYHEYYYEKGKLLTTLDRHEEGIGQINRAIEVSDQDNVDHFLARGRIYLHLNQLDNALADFEKSREIAPGSSTAAYLLGSTSLKLDRYDEALKNLEDANEIYDNSATIIRELAFLLATHPRETLRDPARALEFINVLIADEILDDPDYFSDYAAVFAANGDFENAILWQKKAVESAPEDADEAAADRLTTYEEGKPFRFTLDLP